MENYSRNSDNSGEVAFMWADGNHCQNFTGDKKNKKTNEVTDLTDDSIKPTPLQGATLPLLNRGDHISLSYIINDEKSGIINRCELEFLLF